MTGKNIWLIKAINMNRGRCIKISDNLTGIQSMIKRFKEGIPKEFKESEKEDQEEKTKKKQEKKINHDYSNKYKSGTLILQKYLEKPLLYWGRKFDIRVWVMVTHKFELFVYKEGHLKTSSETYNVNQLDSYIHLTNYSVQKYNDNFGKFESGNEASYKDFQNFLEKEHSDKRIDFKRDITGKINEITTIAFKAVKDKINMNNRRNCFEIFGLDFILDSSFNTYLIEINTNPGLEESSPLIKKIVPRMIDDALRITVDDMFNPKYSEEHSQEYVSPFPVDGYNNSENLWQNVCDLSK